LNFEIQRFEFNTKKGKNPRREDRPEEKKSDWFDVVPGVCNHRRKGGKMIEVLKEEGMQGGL